MKPTTPRCPRGLLQPGQRVQVTTVLPQGDFVRIGQVVSHKRGRIAVKMPDEYPYMGCTLKFVSRNLCTRIGELPVRKLSLLPEETL